VSRLTGRDDSFLSGRNEGGFIQVDRDSGSDPEVQSSLMFSKDFDCRPNDGTGIPQCVLHEYYSSKTASEVRVFLPEARSLEVGYLLPMA
jgi:hypothetical protein